MSIRSAWVVVPALAGMLGCAAHSEREDEQARLALQEQGLTVAEATSSLSPLLDLVLFLKLREHKFTGRAQEKVAAGLGRPVNAKVATLGRDLFFDSLLGLNDDNSCAGCHAPAAAFGDTLSVAVGIDNNGIVGSSRVGPHNQRRTPGIVNTGLYPTLMWNSRFRALSNNPFDNSQGFQFPAPEGMSLSASPTLLHAQAFIPPTERIEMAGNGPHVPGTNDAIRQAVVDRLNETPAYRALFKDALGVDEIAYADVAAAISEFELQQTYANAPIDKFARGQLWAMTKAQKRGALLFFGEAKCVSCHSVSGASNEMFSDFAEHNIGVPQIVPVETNAVFDGPGANEDFGLEQVTGDPNDHCKFRTSPLRNVALQPAFFHNGAFTSLEDAIWHHLNVEQSVASFTTDHLPPGLQGEMGPMDLILEGVDPKVATPIALSSQQFDDLVDFVRNGLLDPNAKPEKLRKLIPKTLPSGRPVHLFE
jgi:cytochrome c peroxidase